MAREAGKFQCKVTQKQILNAALPYSSGTLPLNSTLVIKSTAVQILSTDVAHETRGVKAQANLFLYYKLCTVLNQTSPWKARSRRKSNEADSRIYKYKPILETLKSYVSVVLP
jgi:hypothetical protein